MFHILDRKWQLHYSALFSSLFSISLSLPSPNPLSTNSFFARAYFEAQKTQDGEVREVLVDHKWKRTRIPKPRGIRELVGTYVTVQFFSFYSIFSLFFVNFGKFFIILFSAGFINFIPPSLSLFLSFYLLLSLSPSPLIFFFFCRCDDP